MMGKQNVQYVDLHVAENVVTNVHVVGLLDVMDFAV